MNAHEEFLEGFGDALGITDQSERQAHYEAWIQDTGMTDIERIEIEGLGYITGLEAGQNYKTTVLNPSTR